MKCFENMLNIKEVFELKVILSTWSWPGASQQSRHHVITPGRQTAGILSFCISKTGETSFPFIGGGVALEAGGEPAVFFWTETLSRTPCPLASSKEQDLLVGLFGAIRGNGSCNEETLLQVWWLSECGPYAVSFSCIGVFLHCRQPIAVSYISIYICLIDIIQSKEQLNERRAGLSTPIMIFLPTLQIPIIISFTIIAMQGKG